MKTATSFAAVRILNSSVSHPACIISSFYLATGSRGVRQTSQWFYVLLSSSHHATRVPLYFVLGRSPTPSEAPPRQIAVCSWITSTWVWFSQRFLLLQLLEARYERNHPVGSPPSYLSAATSNSKNDDWWRTWEWEKIVAKFVLRRISKNMLNPNTSSSKPNLEEYATSTFGVKLVV